MGMINVNLTFFQFLIQGKIFTRPPIDFDNPYNLTTYDYRILIGLSLEQFDDLCDSIPNTSVYNTNNRSARMVIGVLLMKLRFALTHETLVVLLGFSDRITVHNLLQSARAALMKHLVSKYLGFEHISRHTLIEQRTRSLAKILLADSIDDNVILVLDSTYVYIQKSTNNELKRKSYSVHKKRPLVKIMMIVSTDGNH